MKFFFIIKENFDFYQKIIKKYHFQKKKKICYGLENLSESLIKETLNEISLETFEWIVFLDFDNLGVKGPRIFSKKLFLRN